MTRTWKLIEVIRSTLDFSVLLRKCQVLKREEALVNPQCFFIPVKDAICIQKNKCAIDFDKLKSHVFLAGWLDNTELSPLYLFAQSWKFTQDVSYFYVHNPIPNKTHQI